MARKKKVKRASPGKKKLQSKLWFKEMGFSSNPFSIKPAAFSFDVQGYGDIIDIIEKAIGDHKVIVISGNFGMGKTSILKAIINHYRGKRNVCYLSCNRIRDEIDVESLLVGKYGFIGRLFRIKGKNMILLLDEANELSKKDFDKIKRYLGTNIKAVILTTDNSERLLRQIGDSDKDDKVVKVSLNDVADEDAIAIIRKRIGDIDVISDKVLAYIYEMSGRNPRLFLENCEDTFKYAYENSTKQITAKDVDSALRI